MQLRGIHSTVENVRWPNREDVEELHDSINQLCEGDNINRRLCIRVILYALKEGERVVPFLSLLSKQTKTILAAALKANNLELWDKEKNTKIILP